MKLSNNLVLLLILFSTLLFKCSTDPGFKDNKKASIKEEYINFKTYPFSDPNPIPNIGTIYPYFKFDGYTNNAIDKDWKMVVMENEYIKVFVCPEIGGKIWGAIEKSTGKEFLYYNHVVKFRNIAMRGPWTSGGLEFNFGDIGHAPSCSTPVDYTIIEKVDGSVSCIVGAYDLPSRTRWNIDINLPKDKAYVETKVSWFNPTNQSTSYYQWMNAAAKAKGNLEFYYPGKNFIGHDGEHGNWPINKDKQISKYENNNFGGYKSYHILNAYSDFFGGYWHDDNFGFGHYTPYDEKPGKKLWIWGLSQQGMIWEDLLTDTDGQYIEYQSGKLFNQAAEGSSLSPYKHKEFEPYASDIISELWFPLKDTKGMVAASKHAVLNIKKNSESATIYLSALENLNETLSIEIDDNIIRKNISLRPLEIEKLTLPNKKNSDMKIVLGNNLLTYNSNKEESLVDRPIMHHEDFNWESAYGKYVDALELEKQRKYPEALIAYQECISIDPGYLDALSRISLGYYRIMDYEKALSYCQQGLSIDTYHPESNYSYGMVNNKLGNISEAKSGFSIASQSIQFRSASYVELAKLFLHENNYTKALHFANKATTSNSNNILAYMIMAFANRNLDNTNEARNALRKVYQLDPLSNFAKMEEVIQQTKPIEYFTSNIRNELPHESYLELAAIYYQLNDIETAIMVLNNCPKNPIAELWLASIDTENQSEHFDQVIAMSAEMVFPHRTETAKFIVDLIKTNSNWKLKYYLGLIYWNKGLISEARDLFDECGNEPEFSAFYLAKNELIKNSAEKRINLERAQDLNSEDWRTALQLSRSFEETKEIAQAITLIKKFTSMYPENSQIGLQYVSLLNKDKQYKESLEFLENFEILPFEGSTEGKVAYTQTCIKLALKSLQDKMHDDAISYAEKAKLWPANLGVGKPYYTDDRIADFIIAQAKDYQGDKSHYAILTEYKHPAETTENSNLYLQLLSLKKMGQERKALKYLKNIEKNEKDNKYVDWVYARLNNNSIHLKLQQQLLAVDVKNSTTEFTTIIELLKIIKE